MTVEMDVRKIPFVTNYAAVLLTIFRDPEIRHLDISRNLGITERAVQRIVHELIAAGHINSRREGRRNVYSFNFRSEVWTPPVADPLTLAEFLDRMLS